MRVEEIALRQEIRQMITEAGINKNTIREMVNLVIGEEVEKQVKNMLNQTNMNALMRTKVNSYEFCELLREAIRQEVRDVIKISVDVKTEVPKSS